MKNERLPYEYGIELFLLLGLKSSLKLGYLMSIHSLNDDHFELSINT